MLSIRTLIRKYLSQNCFYMCIIVLTIYAYVCVCVCVYAYSKINFDNAIEFISLNEINGALFDWSLSSTPGAKLNSLSSGNGLSIALDFARKKKKSVELSHLCESVLFVSINEPNVDCKVSSKEMLSVLNLASRNISNLGSIFLFLF